MLRSNKQAVPELGPGRGAQTLRGEKRRDLILKVAAQLFAENGFDSVSINEIGIAAGITGPAIYRYFASKEALLVSAYKRLYERFSDGIGAILSVPRRGCKVARQDCHRARRPPRARGCGGGEC